jgi:hypothetical protein
VRWNGYEPGVEMLVQNQFLRSSSEPHPTLQFRTTSYAPVENQVLSPSSEPGRWSGSELVRRSSSDVSSQFSWELCGQSSSGLGGRSEQKSPVDWPMAIRLQAVGSMLHGYTLQRLKANTHNSLTACPAGSLDFPLQSRICMTSRLDGKVCPLCSLW